MENRPYISFCIPTFERIDILKNTLNSIYANLDGIGLNDFEVIVSDNEPNQSSKDLVDSFTYKNLYYHATKCEGFLNSFYALQYGKGRMLKLHNNYTQLKPGALSYLIDEVKQNVDREPTISYTNGLKGGCGLSNFDSFDKFMFELSYFSSWSTGFSIWKDAFDKLKQWVVIDKYFPQTSLLLKQSNDSLYIINDLPLFINQDVPKKGGYNIFKVFAVDFIKLIEDAMNKKEIEANTFKKIKRDLLIEYLSVRYFKTVIARIDNFEKTDIKKSISIYYRQSDYYLMVALALFAPFKHFINKLSTGLTNKNCKC